MDKKAKIYVAGHRGLVGSAITRKLKSLWYENLVLRNFKELDLTDQVATKEFFEKEKPEYVILAAAKVWGILWNKSFPAEFIYENLQIQNNVIHNAYAYDVQKLLFLGSSCIYPKHCPQPMKEEYLLTGELEPTNEPYAVAKIAGIKMCQSYNRQYGTNFLACMPTNLYGPYDNFDLKTSHVLPAMIRKFDDAKNNGERVTLRWDGSPMREFLYVDDMADACIFLMQNVECKVQNDQSYLVAGDIEIRWTNFVNMGTWTDVTIKELAETVAKTVGYEWEIERDTNKPNGTPRKLQDVSILSKLGRSHKVELQEWIQKTYERYKNNV